LSVPISLIITVYNRERYLAQAIESVLSQTRGDFELLIWDDGSTDGSLAIARSYEEKDKRVRVVADSHQGFTKTLCQAVASTSGAYLGWVDSDDLLAPTALEETATLLNSQPNVGMVYTDYQVIDEQGTVKGLGKRCQIPFSKDRLLLDFMTFHFRLMRRSLYDEIGGVDSEFRAAQDYDLCLRLSEMTEIVQIKKPLYLYRNHTENISHSKQFEQIHFTHLAISRALQRRGLADKVELEVQVRPKFVLKWKERK
jgi:glycosyltransferase involved in cell wall biosynthesis